MSLDNTALERLTASSAMEFFCNSSVTFLPSDISALKVFAFSSKLLRILAKALVSPPNAAWAAPPTSVPAVIEPHCLDKF